METDDWTLRDWADQATRQLPRKYLERYVGAFESGALAHGCGNCALGRMAGGGAGTGHYRKARREAGLCFGTSVPGESPHKQIARAGADAHPFTIVEATFEAWLPVSSPTARGKEEGKRTLYDSCIEELARRDATASHTEESRQEVTV